MCYVESKTQTECGESTGLSGFDSRAANLTETAISLQPIQLMRPESASRVRGFRRAKYMLYKGSTTPRLTKKCIGQLVAEDRLSPVVNTGIRVLAVGT